MRPAVSACTYIQCQKLLMEDGKGQKSKRKGLARKTAVVTAHDERAAVLLKSFWRPPPSRDGCDRSIDAARSHGEPGSTFAASLGLDNHLFS